MPPRGSLLLLAAAFCAQAQEAKFSTDVKVVTLLATVRDRDGHIVRDLTRDDFDLLEDGRPQTIRYFSQESDLPLKIGLLVDTSRSQIRILEPERKASYTFLDQVLQDRDRAFVVHFDIRVSLLQGFTSSREELGAALTQLRIPKRPSTLLYDAVRETSEELMRHETGRKAFIVLSDGVDVHSRNSIVTAIEFAQRADTLIYSIVFADHVAFSPMVIALNEAYLARGRRAMQRMARETGGEYFKVGWDEPIEKIYSQIEDELRHQYSIGYTSDQPESNGKYRKIQLTAKRKSLTVRTRDGYYP
ncbi:MAG TPA: VWA domain-containing protein [Bryobacteraceae bacterium]|nr:VWA domain-containing protein [Bryobacteraceae bacterium]